jgi:RNA polymerase sigma-70 factor (ECF subfamily)
MDAEVSLSDRFEAERARLQALALRMLGSADEAEDAVQEGWLRAARMDAEVVNLSGWLTTAVSRVCLDMLRSRKSRREDPLLGDEDPLALIDDGPSPEQDAALSDAVGYAMQVVLDTLGPAERVAFVLHDLFGLTFEEIGPVVGRSEAATRQLASRARRRVRGAEASSEADFRRKRELIEAFVAAARDGDLQSLLAVLDPKVELRGDSADEGLQGRDAVAGFFSGRARTAQPALVDGELAIVVRRNETVFLVLQVVVGAAGIQALEAVGDPARLATFDIADLGAELAKSRSAGGN